MGNAKSASFQVDQLEESTKTRHSRKRFSLEDVNLDKEHHFQRPASLYETVYAESSTSEYSSKESETMSTLSSTSTTDNIPAYHRTKAPLDTLVIPEIVVDPPCSAETGMRRRSKTWQTDSAPHFDSFFDQIVETIENEAGKTSPKTTRRSTVSSGTRPQRKKRWSTITS